jgi:hypothetical protein
MGTFESESLDMQSKNIISKTFKIATRRDADRRCSFKQNSSAAVANRRMFMGKR